jgi:hypothetical protein
MSWGETVSADMDVRGRKQASPSNAKAFGKIGAQRGTDCEDLLIKKRTVVLDMGEASREQGFKLYGCR